MKAFSYLRFGTRGQGGLAMSHLYHRLFELLDEVPGLDGLQAGRIAHEAAEEVRIALRYQHEAEQMNAQDAAR